MSPVQEADAAAGGGAGGVSEVRQRKGGGSGSREPLPVVPSPSPSSSPAAAAAAAGSGARPPTAAADSTSVHRMVSAVVSTLLWMVFSSAVIILNKQLYAGGFAYPSTVTGVGQLLSALSGLLLSRVASQPLRPTPGPRVFLRALLPIAACTSASMYFGNMAYLHLSVSFIQILKAFTPAITLLLCVLAGLETPSWPLISAIAMIVGGTAGAVLVESGAPSFSAMGFAAFMASSVTEAARVVGAELLRDGAKYNTAESLVYIGGPTALLLLAGAAVWEGPKMLADTRAGRGGGLALVAAAPLTFIAAPAVSALVNMSCFFAINATSSLTFKVAGCVKNLAVVVYGVVAHGDAITALQMAGYAVSVVGFMLYSQLKMAPKPRHAVTVAARAGNTAVEGQSKEVEAARQGVLDGSVEHEKGTTDGKRKAA